MTIHRLETRIAETTLVDLHVRLAATRLPPATEGDGAHDWRAGTNPAYLRELLAYWQDEFDWRAYEDELRKLAHFTTTLGDTKIHFIHERGRGAHPMPLVLTHGFPDSFLRFTKLLPLLVDPARHGGDPDDAFDVIVPSLPGYGFSGPPGRGADLFHIADRWHELMTELGYRRYGAHGGDWGSTITEHLARSHWRSIVGIHLTDVPFWHAFRKPRNASGAERAYFAQMDGFQQREGAYAMIQGSRPRTLADGLDDSPAGLVAWLVDFFERWSDCDGDVENSFSKDDLLANAMLYWASGSVGATFAPYFDLVHAGAKRWIVETAKQFFGGGRVETGFALFPKDLSHPPREWAERFFDVTRWTEMPHGGHFAAMEEPEALAHELREFFRPLRARL